MAEKVPMECHSEGDRYSLSLSWYWQVQNTLHSRYDKHIIVYCKILNSALQANIIVNIQFCTSELKVIEGNGNWFTHQKQIQHLKEPTKWLNNINQTRCEYYLDNLLYFQGHQMQKHNVN